MKKDDFIEYDDCKEVVEKLYEAIYGENAQIIVTSMVNVLSDVINEMSTDKEESIKNITTLLTLKMRHIELVRKQNE